MIKERIPLSGDLKNKVKQLMIYAGWYEGRKVDISIASQYYAERGVPMMKSTRRFYHKYFGLCCQWYFSGGMKRAADFEFGLFPYLINGIKDHLEDTYFRNMSGAELDEIEQIAGEQCQPIGQIGYYYPAQVWISEFGKLYAKYEYQDEIEDIIKAANILRDDLMEGISKDAESFLPLAGAYSLPANTEEEKRIKEKTLEELLVVAASAPLELIKKIIPAMEILERLTDIGTKLAISDVGTGLLLCDAAATAAALNVYCNTKLMKNRELANKMDEEADELLKRSFQIRANNLPKVIVSLRADENI